MARYIESPHPQGTPEWMADRLGKVTGSNADALFTGGKGKVRDGYREDLVVEIMNGVASKSSFNFLGYAIGVDHVSVRDKTIQRIKKQVS